MNTTIGSRIKMLRNELGLSMAAFGDKIKMTNSNISKMEKDLRTVTDRTIAIICNEFSVNEHWLRTGEGEMFKMADDVLISEFVNEYRLSDLERKLVESFVQLNEEDRKAVTNYVLSLSEILRKNNELTATTVEPTPEQIAAAEAEKYRLEVLAELKGAASSASVEHDKKLG